MVTTMTTRRGRYSAGQETRTLLIHTAERLFAQRGYYAVTLAEIRDAAGQHNASVIGYYFGSKEKLLRAIFDHRLPRIGADRDALIGKLRSEEGELTVRDGLWSLVEPLFDSVGRGEHYVGLLDRLMETDILGDTFNSANPQAIASGLAVDRALSSAMTDVPEYARRQRIMMVYESVLRTLACYSRSSEVPGRTELTALVDAWEGLLRAPTSAETRAVHDGPAPDTALSR